MISIFFREYYFCAYPFTFQIPAQFAGSLSRRTLCLVINLGGGQRFLFIIFFFKLFLFSTVPPSGLLPLSSFSDLCSRGKLLLGSFWLYCSLQRIVIKILIYALNLPHLGRKTLSPIKEEKVHVCWLYCNIKIQFLNVFLIFMHEFLLTLRSQPGKNIPIEINIGKIPRKYFWKFFCLQQNIACTIKQP